MLGVMRASHRFFDHTGDFGVDLEAPTELGLYEEAARSLVVLLTDAIASIEPRETRPIEVSGVDGEDLLVALANEVLYLFEAEGWLTARVEVEALDDEELRAIAHGEPFDPARHPIARPIKAVTHHGAEVQERDGAWHGRLIFDL
jgi:SHS2 domain-containing protein